MSSCPNCGESRYDSGRFEGQKIHFDVRDGVVRVNAIETAKPYGKQPKDFLKTDHTKEYMKALESDRNILLADQAEVVQGNFSNGRTQGTWLHDKLALRFAGWLDVKLQIWMDEPEGELCKEWRPIKPVDIKDLKKNAMLIQPWENSS